MTPPPGPGAAVRSTMTPNNEPQPHRQRIEIQGWHIEEELQLHLQPALVLHQLESSIRRRQEHRRQEHCQKTTILRSCRHLLARRRMN
mmetsp:Transcript_24720/g.62140  ORF Transcript_24720/g.62140 Transcript_24720/m.62140 type:complete len:88 (+) Transcript_24720:1324-1587(+)